MINIFIKRLYTNLGFADELSFENYLIQYNWEINEVKKKIEIESLWNQLIYDRYKNQIKIDKDKLKEKIKNNIKEDTFVKGDHEKLIEVFSNIIDNSIKYSEQNKNIDIY